MIVDIISGFLGAGKTTLIKKILEEGYKDESVVLIENEFGEVGIDSEFLNDAGIQIKEMNAGCICCSIVGDFSDALIEVAKTYNPDRILIEPSGVGKLSDVIKAIEKIDGMHVGVRTCVVDVKKFDMYKKNFKEFYQDQIENATTIVLSRVQMVDMNKVLKVMKEIEEWNQNSHVISSDWNEIDGKVLLEEMKHNGKEFDSLIDDTCACGHHHDTCNHTHEHDEECGCGAEHTHEHGEGCECSGKHHHHHAEDVFVSIGWETAREYSELEIKEVLEKLSEEERFDSVLRCKGLVPSNGKDWIYFDYTPKEFEIRKGKVQTTGKIVVIGSMVDEKEVRVLFGS